MNQTTIELAIQALEAEKAKITAAIAELSGGARSGTTARSQATATASALVAPAKAQGRRGKRRFTAAGRAALALAAKRRWVKAKAAGKSRL